MLRSCPMIANDCSPGRWIIDRLRSRVADSDIVGDGKNASKKSRPVMARLSMPESVARGLFGFSVARFTLPKACVTHITISKRLLSKSARSPYVSHDHKRDHKMGKEISLVSGSNNWKSATSKRSQSKNQSADSLSSCQSNAGRWSPRTRPSGDSTTLQPSLSLSLSLFLSFLWIVPLGIRVSLHNDGASRFAKWRNNICT